MGRKVDVSQLVDSQTVADMLGLSSRRVVSTYRTRYPDFPAPVLESDAGRCLLWERADVERWAKKTGRMAN